MIGQIVALARKDLAIFLKDRGAIVFVFLQPFMFIIVMSYALSGMFAQGSEEPIMIVAVNQDKGEQGAALIRSLNSSGVFLVQTEQDGLPIGREQAEALVKDGQYRLALVLPPDLTMALAQAKSSGPATIQVVADPATSNQFIEPVLGTVQGMLQRTAFAAVVPIVVGGILEQHAPQLSAAERDRLAQLVVVSGSGGGRAVVLERKAPAGMKASSVPNSYQQNVPGYTIYGIFWIVSLLAASVLEERRSGTFRRLLVAPMNRAVMLAGKLIPYYLINLTQLALMLGVSALLFGMSLGASAAGLVAVCLAAGAAATGLGVLVAGLARTDAQIGGLTTLLLLTMSALGGCFIPRFVMPEWLKTAGLATPHAWALDGFQDLLVRGGGLADVLPEVGVLMLFAALFFGVGVWRFRFN